MCINVLQAVKRAPNPVILFFPGGGCTTIWRDTPSHTQFLVASPVLPPPIGMILAEPHLISSLFCRHTMSRMSLFLSDLFDQSPCGLRSVVEYAHFASWPSVVRGD